MSGNGGIATETGPTCQVSVIIPTYQRVACMERILQALARQTLPPDRYEVVVSIDGSQDGTREMVEHLAAPYRLRSIWHPNSGRSAARNRGIQASLGDWVIFFDDDIEPAPGCLAAHVQSHAAGPRLGVLGPVPIIVDPASPPMVKYMARKFDDTLGRLAQPGYTLQLRDFYGGNFSIRKSVLLQAGLFDEGFTIYGNEDLELYLRLSKLGVQFIYNPEALAHQHYFKSLAEVAQDNIAKGRTAILLAHKHPGAVGDLKLGTFSLVSNKWRMARALLLGLGRRWAGTSGWVLRSMSWAERRRPAHLNLYYSFVLDYFFWSGVQSALRDESDTSDPADLAARPFTRSRV